MLQKDVIIYLLIYLNIVSINYVNQFYNCIVQSQKDNYNKLKQNFISLLN